MNLQPKGGGLNQRWRQGRDSYRPAGEVIRTSDFDVAPVPEAEAKAFVLEHHYSGTFPAARERFGLIRKGQVVGVAVFSQPCSQGVLAKVFGEAAPDSVELGRFVLLDEVAGNGETWFLGQAFRHLKLAGYAGVLSFSDPMPRRSVDGALVFPGHIGTIYQAHNARYLGLSTARTLRLLPDGSVLSDRAISKIRTGDQGWSCAVGQLVRHGVLPPGCWTRGEADADELRGWLPRAMAQATRPMRHAGNYRYAWSLSKKLELPAPVSAPGGGLYPKLRVA